MTMHREFAASALVVISGCFAILVGPGISRDATAQPTWHNLEAGDHAVGFRLLQEHDNTRVVAGSTDQARPVRIYLWYPAEASPGVSPMRFGRYAAFAEDDVWPVEVSGALHDRLSFSNHVLARSLGTDGHEALGEQPVRAFENAEALPGPYPLIVVGQGLNYESPIAFAALSEYLAGRGFVVATCPLVGTQTPFVKLDARDLESQVRDLEFVIARVRALPNVSPDGLGVMGFDMGGMAGLILAMRNAGVDAFASLHSGILFPHPSGVPAASPDYDPYELRVPWLHVGLQRMRVAGSQEASLFETAMHSDRYHLLIDDLEHVDSTSYALVEGRDARLGFWSAWSADGAGRHATLSRYVSEFFKAYLMNSTESLAFLSRAQSGTGEAGVTLEYRSATPSTMTYAQFVDALLAGDGASAMDEVRALRDVEPSNILLNDWHLYRLTYTLLYRWGLSDEALSVSKLNMELNPSSTLAAQGLSMSYVDRGDHVAAVDVYRKLLEMNPDDDNVKRTLEWLQGQLELSRHRN